VTSRNDLLERSTAPLAIDHDQPVRDGPAHAAAHGRQPCEATEAIPHRAFQGVGKLVPFPQLNRDGLLTLDAIECDRRDAASPSRRSRERDSGTRRPAPLQLVPDRLA
jgi:hypothetical protein